MAKKYYWLKLKEDFFTDIRIKKLRRLAGGDTYTVIYLKMMLKSMNTGGLLEYNGLEDSFAEELALDLDESADNITVTLNFLMKTGLMECTDDKNYLLTSVPDSVGGESASAKRVREYRKREKLLQCNADVTGCNTEKRREEKEIDKDKEIDRDKDKEIDKDKIKDKRKREKESKKESKKEKATEIATEKSKATEKTYYPLDEKLNKAFSDFVENRKKIKKPMTDIAIDRAIKKLDNLTNDPDEKIEILNQSIVGSWTGLYPLKSEKKQTSGSAYIDAINNRMQPIDDWLKEYGQND